MSIALWMVAAWHAFLAMGACWDLSRGVTKNPRAAVFTLMLLFTACAVVCGTAAWRW